MRRSRTIPWWLPLAAALLFLLMIATLWAMGTGRVRSRHGAQSRLQTGEVPHRVSGSSPVFREEII